MFLFTSTSQAAVQHDIEYCRAGDLSLRLDASIPDSPGPHPAVILVHGGAWVSGDRVHTVAPLFAPLENAGFAWFSVSYRFASDLLALGTAVDDVQEAVRFVRANASRFHIDPERLALVGESAGAQLAQMAAARLPRESSVKAIVALYSPTDLVSLAQTSPLVPPPIREAIKGTMFAEVALAFLRSLSPIANINPQLPPTLLIHGTEDSVVPFDQSVRYCDSLKANHVPCELYAVKGGEHGIRSWRALKNDNYQQHLLDWLQKYTTHGVETGAAISKDKRS
jgi:alpha-L-fucosidase 2